IKGTETPKYRAADLLYAAPTMLGKNYEGYEPEQKPNHPGGRWSMHCEIEGDGMYTLCSTAKTLALLGPIIQPVGALVGGGFLAVQIASSTYDAVHSGCRKACSIPILCDIVCFFTAALAAATLFVAGLIVAPLVLFAIPGLAPLAAAAVLGLLARQE